MALITTISQAKQYVRLPNVSEDASLPNMDRAGRRFLEPILGPLYQELDDAVDNGDPTGYDATLLERCRAALAPLAYWAELGYNAAALTDAGVRQQASENMPAAFRWQYMELKEALHDQGAEALDALWRYLQQNAGTLGWQEPAGPKTVFADAAEFAIFYPIAQAARVYANVRPFIGEVLDHYVYDVVGSEIVDHLYAEKYAEGVPGKANDLLKKCVAHYTIMVAIDKLNCKLTQNGFVVQLGDKEMPDGNKADVPSDNRLGHLRTQVEQTGARYLKQLKTFLDKNAADEPALELYLNSEYYTAPGSSSATDPNDSYTGIFVM